MTSREIVRKTLDFENPERVARTFDGTDFAGAGCSVKTYATGWSKREDGMQVHKDGWGNLWGRVDETSKGEVIDGVLKSVDDIEGYVFPDFSKPEDYLKVREVREGNMDKWLIGYLPGFPFVIARDMFKLEDYLVNLLVEYEKVRKLHDKIDDMLETIIINYALAGVDSIMFCEDWGTQSQTLISPDLWHKEFFPRYTRLCKAAHEHSIKVFMHSCGAIKAIIPGLIKAGVDLLQFDQVDIHGVDTLESFQENAKITFWCGVDIQKTLQTRDEKIICDAANNLLNKLWKGRGGYIAGFYGDERSIGLEPVWQRYACEEFLKNGLREKIAGNSITNK
jgi:hypothetical protein